MSEKGGKGFSVPQPQKRGRKPSLKSTNGKEAPLKGKDDSSEKSKKGRKVQFDTGAPEVNLNFSSQYGGNIDTPTTLPKGGSGLGGKGDKTGKSGKTSVPKPPRPLELRIEEDLPKGAKCLMDCEAADILQGIQERMVLLSKDPTIKIPASFDKGLQYAKRESYYTNSQSVKDILEYPCLLLGVLQIIYTLYNLLCINRNLCLCYANYSVLYCLFLYCYTLNSSFSVLAIYGLTEGEICVIANICPETADEVFALLPSLKAKKRMLSEPIKDVLLELAKVKQSTSTFSM